MNANNVPIPLIPGLLELNTADLSALPAVETNARGVVLSNQRVRVRAWEGTNGDIPVDYVVSIYAQRSPLTPAETEAIDKAAREAKGKREAKAQQDQDIRDREIRRAVDLTKDVVRDAYKDQDNASKALLNMIQAATKA